MGTTKEAGAETTESEIATLAQKAVQRTPFESNQPKYEPRKIPNSSKRK